MNNDYPSKLLFLCTGNSARSIFAEYLLRRIGGPRFQVVSAEADPTGVVNPFAVEVLKEIYRIDAATSCRTRGLVVPPLENIRCSLHSSGLGS